MNELIYAGELVEHDLEKRLREVSKKAEMKMKWKKNGKKKKK